MAEALRKVRRRLPPAEREKRIVEEAIRFFSEVGFSGRTRELAQRIGMTQPLLFRYFPTKAALVERIYQEVFLDLWDESWEALIRDCNLSLRERLIRFYGAYTRAIFTYEWIRIYMYAGLRDAKLNRRYIKRIEERILKPICDEIRAVAGLPAKANTPRGRNIALELAWTMHGGIFYHGVRKYIYGTPVASNLDAVIIQAVDAMLAGAAAFFNHPDHGRARRPGAEPLTLH